MVRQFNWYDPMLTRRMRHLLTAIIWVAWLTIVFLQYENIVRMLHAMRQDG
jgi:hypothetical protein